MDDSGAAGQAQRYLDGAATKVNRSVVGGDHFSRIVPSGETWDSGSGNAEHAFALKRFVEKPASGQAMTP